MKKLKLTIELVPYDSFQKNLHHLLSKNDWNLIRKHTYKKYGYCCGICKKSNVVLSAHEEWVYKVNSKKKKTGTQKLKNILSLCEECHMIKHIAFADELARQGKLNMDNLLNHFYTINKCNEDVFVEHYNESIKKWNELSDIKFKIDISYIETLELPLSYQSNSKSEV